MTIAPAQQTPATAPDRPGSWWRQPYLWLVLLLGIVAFNAIYALPRYLSFDESKSRSQLNPAHHSHYGLLVAHVVTGNIALITVLLQLWPWLRRNYPQVHRFSGRIYILAGVLPAALLALFVIIPWRDGGYGGPGSVGFAAQGVVWIGTTIVGWRMARQRRWAEHQRWMIYSFAMALGTSWGRILFETLSTFPTLGKHVSIFVMIEVSTWLGWVVGLLIAHVYIERRGLRSSKSGGQVVNYPSPVR